MYELAKLAGYFLSPLTIAFVLALLAAVCFVKHHRRRAAGLVTAAFAILWIASTPWVGREMTGYLERQYPAVTVAQTPQADAILVLGGALAGAHPPQRPNFVLGPAADRVWHAARLYRAGKAKWLVISGGNQPGQEMVQAEGDAIAQMLGELGVPASALRRETASRTTLENAQRVRAVLDSVGARRILLVTSAQHMPRAVKTFAKVWAGSEIEVIPSSADVQVTEEHHPWKLWLPSLEALNSVSKALKEFAGMAVLSMM